MSSHPPARAKASHLRRGPSGRYAHVMCQRRWAGAPYTTTRQSPPGSTPPAQRRQARAGLDGELLGELRYLLDYGSVVPPIGDDQDQSLRPEVALFRPRPSLDRLDIVEPSLALDDSADASSIDRSVGAPQIARDRDRYLCLPAQRLIEPRCEPPEQRDVASVADRSRDGMESQAQLAAQDRRHLREHIEVDVRCSAGLDAADLCVGDPDEPAESPRAHPIRHAGDAEFLASPPEKVARTSRRALACRLMDGHVRHGAIGRSPGDRQRMHVDVSGSSEPYAGSSRWHLACAIQRLSGGGSAVRGGSDADWNLRCAEQRLTSFRSDVPPSDGTRDVPGARSRLRCGLGRHGP